jgi:polyadenylate-binding protein
MGAGGMPGMQGMRGPPGVNYQLMPARMGGIPGMNGPGGMNRNAGVNANNPRGNRGNQRGAGGPMNGMKLPPNANGLPGMNQQTPGNIRYADNVRNRSQLPMQIPGGANAGMNPNMPIAQQDSVQMPAPNEPLTIKALAAAPEEMRKQMIGERLFPLIKLQEPALAGKITGMLLEMDNGELIHLLESQQALNEKIVEALQVLQAHPGAAQETGDNQQEAETDK